MPNRNIPLSKEEKEKGKKFQAVWDTLTPDEKLAFVNYHCSSKDENRGDDAELMTGEEKLERAGYRVEEVCGLIELVKKKIMIDK